MDGFPKCQVCHEHFTLKGPTPYLLPCLHAVCETCVTSIAGGVISCSTCLREVVLTETPLQKDVMRQREIFHLTVQHRPSDLLCTHEDDGNQAVCWCQECEEFLCEYCQTLHESFKATRKHVVQDVDDIQPGSLDHEEYCSIHKKYLLDTWDRGCKMLICGRCRLADHAQHDLDDVSAAADAARSEIEAQQNDVLQVRDNCNSLLETTREHLKHTTETSRKLSDNISHTFQSLKSVLDQREKELHILLQQHTDQATSQLDSKTKVAQSHHLRCQIVLEYIQRALLYSMKGELLMVKCTLEEKTQTSPGSTTEQEDVTIPEFYTEGLDKLKMELSAFGDMYTQKDAASHRRAIEDKATQTGGDSLVRLEYIQQQHEKEIQGLQSELMNAEASNKDLQTSVATLMRQKEEAENAIKESQTRFEKAEIELKQLQTSVRGLTCERDDVRKQERETAVLLRQQGIHFMKTSILNNPYMLNCVHLMYNLQKVNIDRHINSNGELVNDKDTDRPSGNTSERFQNYDGTTSTVPLSKSPTLQYVELLSDVMVDEPLKRRDLVLSTGVCREHDRDVHHHIPPLQYCYRLDVAQCPQHNSVCTGIWKDGKEVHHLPDTLHNTAGSHTTLHHGVTFDSTRNRVVFLDVKQMKEIGALDNVDYTQPLWPMFGVYNPHLARVSMKLVAGNDIDMTPEKKALILEAM